MGNAATFARLDQIAKAIGEIATPAFKRDLGRRLGAAALKKLNDGFNAGRNPYGVPWAPLKRRFGKILIDTARLRNSYSAQPTSNGFQISTNVDYAEVHQHGAHIPPHSRVGDRELLVNPNTRRIVSAAKAKRLKLVEVYKFNRQTFADGITIPRRQMVPEPDTGGVGDVWGAELNAEADRALRDKLEQR